MFPTNQATWDRVLRIVVAVVMLVVGWLGLFEEPWNLALIIFAFYPFVTGASGWCPVYVLLERQTKRTRVK